MYALVPVVPGPVTQISASLETAKDSSELGGNWYACGSSVAVNWTFSGSSFSPPGANPSVPQSLQIQAMNALKNSDSSVVRCYSAGVAVPADFQTYRAMLRDIANGTDKSSTVLPTAPSDFPAGT